MLSRSSPITFTAVATDLNLREEVWLREGKLFDAIRGSIARPLVFTPFKHGSRVLLDGAQVNPVPIGPTLEDSTDLTIVVNLSGAAVPNALSSVSTSLINNNSYRKRIVKFIDGLKLTREPAQPRHGLIDVAFVSMQAMQDTISQLRLATYSPDVKIEIPRTPAVSSSSGARRS